MKYLIIFAVFPVIFIVGKYRRLERSIWVLFLRRFLLALGENLDVARYRQEALWQHNQYRSECHVGNLRSNATLDQKADEWCKKMAAHKIFEHSGGIENGENSFMKNPFDLQRDNGSLVLIECLFFFHWFSYLRRYTGDFLVWTKEELCCK